MTDKPVVMVLCLTQSPGLNGQIRIARGGRDKIETGAWLGPILYRYSKLVAVVVDSVKPDIELFTLCPEGERSSSSSKSDPFDLELGSIKADYLYLLKQYRKSGGNYRADRLLRKVKDDADIHMPDVGGPVWGIGWSITRQGKAAYGTRRR
jgi:hypothetical protein